jgi:hypothetical protein
VIAILKEWQIELQHDLDKSYILQRLVKSGADLEVILYSSVKKCKKLTKKDTIFIWGGAKDVSKTIPKGPVRPSEIYTNES